MITPFRGIHYCPDCGSIYLDRIIVDGTQPPFYEDGDIVLYTCKACGCRVYDTPTKDNK